jgi:hypothetical protein
MLKLRHLLLAGVAALALTPVVAGGPAFAGGDDRSTLYATHGWWQIRLFQDGTCYAFATYEYDQVIRIGVVGREDYYIMLASPGVNGLRPVNGFPIVAKFDNGQSYQGEANVVVSESGKTKIMEFPIGGHMMNSFMQANNMNIHARTQQAGYHLVASMDLRGTYAAMLKTVECTIANGGNYSRPANPFNV